MARPMSDRHFMSPLLIYVLQILTIYFVIFYAAPALARPERADRMQLYRNSDRGLPYLKLSQTGAASSSAPIVMRPVRQIELDGDPLLNVRGNLYPIHLANNGAFGFVHFNGYRFIRVYDAGGRKLWQVTNRSGRVHRDTIHRDTLAVVDGDGDGDQDIVALLGRAAAGRSRCCVVADRGRYCMPGQPRHVLAERRVPDRGIPGTRPRATRSILVAEPPTGEVVLPRPATTSTPGRGPCAFDINLTLALGPQHLCCRVTMLTRSTATGRPSPARIFIGHHLYGPTGNRICSVDLGGTHADSVAVGDLYLGPHRAGGGGDRPQRASRRVARRKTARCWERVPNATISNPQHAHAWRGSIAGSADADAGADPPRVASQERRGLFAQWHRPDPGPLPQERSSSRISAMPFQNANLDGEEGTDELMIFIGRVLDRNGTIRLGTDWYWNLTATRSADRVATAASGHLVPLPAGPRPGR